MRIKTCRHRRRNLGTSGGGGSQKHLHLGRPTFSWTPAQLLSYKIKQVFLLTFTQSLLCSLPEILYVSFCEECKYVEFLGWEDFFTHGVDGWQFQLFELGFLLDVGGKITPHFVCMLLALKAQEKNTTATQI